MITTLAPATHFGYAHTCFEQHGRSGGREDGVDLVAQRHVGVRHDVELGRRDHLRHVDADERVRRQRLPVRKRARQRKRLARDRKWSEGGSFRLLRLQTEAVELRAGTN
jgi:hypothetical protein